MSWWERAKGREIGSEWWEENVWVRKKEKEREWEKEKTVRKEERESFGEWHFSSEIRCQEFCFDA